MDKACKECLGCNRMELLNWNEHEFCVSSPDPERRYPPAQMTLDGVEEKGRKKS